MLKKYLSNFLTVITLIFFAYYLYGHIHILDPIINAPAWPMIGIAVLKVLIIIISSLLTIYTLEAFNKKIPWKESGYVSLLTSIGNYFGPILGGTGIRAAYLKRKFDFPYTHFIGTLYGYYLIFFFADALMGLLAILFIAYSGHYSQTTTIFYGAVFLTTGVLMFMRLPYLRTFEEIKVGWLRIFFRRLAQVSDGWSQFSGNKKLMRKMMAVAFILLGIDILTAYFEFSALHINGSFWAIVLYASLGNISTLVNITPGSIGIREAIYIFTASLMGINLEQVVQLATIDRGIKLIVLIAGYVLAHVLFKQYLVEQKNQPQQMQNDQSA